MKFFTDGFNLEIISKGGFIDGETWADRRYMIETYILRLNSVALGEYYKAEPINSYLTYEKVHDYLKYENEKKRLMERWMCKVTSAIGIPEHGTPGHGVVIQQVLSEIFALVHTYRCDTEGEDE